MHEEGIVNIIPRFTRGRKNKKLAKYLDLDKFTNTEKTHTIYRQIKTQFYVHVWCAGETIMFTSVR